MIYATEKLQPRKKHKTDGVIGHGHWLNMTLSQSVLELHVQACIFNSWSKMGG